MPLFRPVTQRPEPDLRTATIQQYDAVRNPFALRLVSIHAHIRPHTAPGCQSQRATRVRGPGSIGQEWLTWQSRLA